jgi:hypothetical protein
VCAIADPVHALTVQSNASSGGGPPQIDYLVGSNSPPELTIQLQNEMLVDTLPIFLWQLGLAIDRDASSTGEVKFSSVAVPVDPLFGDFSAPDSNPNPTIDTPQSDIVVIDADFSPTSEGVVILAGAAHNILRLGTSVSADAEGLFTLTMSGCDAKMPDQSSCWLPAGDGSELTPFDNPPYQMESQGSVLATILVSQPGPHGDYNGNRVVDAADYTVWRDHLGQMLGLANENPAAATPGLVDLEDYLFWKANFGLSIGSGAAELAGSHAAAPEPTSVCLLVAGAAAAVLLGLNTQRRSARQV